jgi:predicted trehalose synthase
MLPHLEEIARWMPAQRWYAGKDHEPRLRVLDATPLPSSDPDAVITTYLLMDDAASPPVLYQVPVVERRSDVEPQGSFAALDDGTWLVDGPRDLAYTRALLTALAPEIGPKVVTTALMAGEQSNTSIVFTLRDEPDVIGKVFRSLHHGENPDVTLQAALSAAGSPYVPRFVGGLEGEWDDVGRAGGRARGNLAFAQEFLAGARDGWRLALEAAANNEDFVGHARALGEATAAVHATLAEVLPASEPSTADIDDIAAAWQRRLDVASREVPAVAALADSIREVYAAARESLWPPLQRVHGDLHLGQVLYREQRGWVLVDFEGEPLRPMDERNRPDSAIRDVAGMLRSFDYAAGATAGWPTEWARACREAYLDGYRERSPLDLDEHSALLDAFEIDKAVYEAVYEARNRPTWLGIPVRGIDSLLERRTTGTA